MSSDLILAVIVVVFGASGVFLMLPYSHGEYKPGNVHAAGAGLAGLALLLFAALWRGPGAGIDALFFYAFSLASVACAVLTITSRDPIHSALWFAAVVLATAGLFLQAGASFLAVGTVIVYAGAIIVTFLFVIMLAQMEGRALYDRASRMPFRATWTCFALFLAILWSILHVPRPAPLAAGAPGSADVAVATAVARDLSRTDEIAWRAPTHSRAAVGEALARSVRPTARLTDIGPEGTPVFKPHVAGLGETLYTDHLIVVELTGALLFVALVGAVAIAAPKAPARPDGRAGELGTVREATPTTTPTRTPTVTV